MKAKGTTSKHAIVTVAQHAHVVLAVRWNSRSSRWPCYAQVQRSDVIEGYNRLVDHMGIHDQRRLTEALCKGSLVRRKEYPTESSPQANHDGT
ncbi:hypothetical protein Taro_002665 [Colocasia esculenta]|uniref:Uncharacterized protein n=1 Tax=Colocasia esculenta TaxID=4460 RepID=A0A843TLI6_COLES|nr:hypothetical protein [Colocasia esculenta]